MQFTVETWDPAYGSTVRDHDLGPSDQAVDATVERSPVDWRPLTPADRSDHTGTITFVDGVRRIDARLWISEPDGRSRPGVCASVAAGAVRCRPGRAELTKVVVERGLYTASGQGRTIDSVDGAGGFHGHYRLRPVADDSDESLYLGVHRHMTELESRLADDIDEPGMVVFDGPLGHRDGVNAVGYVKTHHVDYLADEQQLVIVKLGPGQRTPLFRIEGRWPSWSWYLRLPGPVSHAMSGIVRLELPGVGDAEGAADRADEISGLLPRFASERHKDPRAPQNLYPIAGLERQLRRRLGDPRLLERSLRRSAA